MRAPAHAAQPLVALLCATLCAVLGASPAWAGPPYVPPAPPAPAPAPAPDTAPAADEADAAVPAEQGEVREEEVDFEEEEKNSDAQSAQIKAAAGAAPSGAPAGGGPAGMGFKLFVDLLAIGKLGQDNFAIKPNHTYAFLMAQVTDELSFILHVSDDPIFFELQWDLLPGLSLKAGKLLVPFGTNDFHHLIGGRIDQQSLFLPETWSDFGVSVNHAPLDTEWFGLEYTVYLLNGFQGTEAPTIAAGTGVDNNYWKGLGARSRLTLFSDYVLTGSGGGAQGGLAAQPLLWRQRAGRRRREGEGRPRRRAREDQEGDRDRRDAQEGRKRRRSTAAA